MSPGLSTKFKIILYYQQDIVKAMVLKLNLRLQGITPDLAGIQSLQIGGAMALKLQYMDIMTHLS